MLSVKIHLNWLNGYRGEDVNRVTVDDSQRVITQLTLGTSYSAELKMSCCHCKLDISFVFINNSTFLLNYKSHDFEVLIIIRSMCITRTVTLLRIVPELWPFSNFGLVLCFSHRLYKIWQWNWGYLFNTIMQLFTPCTMYCALYSTKLYVYFCV